ncbi:MAG TPA: ATP-binding cassette domain-containing protein [Actinomycetes bacterium]|jgi:branched-chain amino acid transport system ATP-binding protein|nr:ATP-binding cassette domain-containing protein [Actinomycetes bacterium]
MTPPLAGAAELRVEDLVAGYDTGRPVLRGISLTAAAGRLTAILGPNGAGKSTLLRVLAGLLLPTSGRVLLDDRDIAAGPAHQRLLLGVGFLPQGRSVFPELSVGENLELGGWVLRGDRRRLAAAVAAMYERYPTLRSMRDKPAGSLSGGQQRTLEVARLLVAEPRVLLVDEPTAGLAPIIADQVYEELLALKAEGRTILLVDQNVQAAIDIADYVITVESGAKRLEGEAGRFAGSLDELIKGWLRV